MRRTFNKSVTVLKSSNFIPKRYSSSNTNLNATNTNLKTSRIQKWILSRKNRINLNFERFILHHSSFHIGKVSLFFTTGSFLTLVVIGTVIYQFNHTLENVFASTFGRLAYLLETVEFTSKDRKLIQEEIQSNLQVLETDQKKSQIYIGTVAVIIFSGVYIAIYLSNYVTNYIAASNDFLKQRIAAPVAVQNVKFKLTATRIKFGIIGGLFCGAIYALQEDCILILDRLAKKAKAAESEAGITAVLEGEQATKQIKRRQVATLAILVFGFSFVPGMAIPAFFCYLASMVNFYRHKLFVEKSKKAEKGEEATQVQSSEKVQEALKTYEKPQVQAAAKLEEAAQEDAEEEDEEEEDYEEGEGEEGEYEEGEEEEYEAKEQDMSYLKPMFYGKEDNKN